MLQNLPGRFLFRAFLRSTFCASYEFSGSRLADASEALETMGWAEDGFTILPCCGSRTRGPSGRAICGQIIL